MPRLGSCCSSRGVLQVPAGVSMGAARAVLPGLEAGLPVGSLPGEASNDVRASWSQRVWLSPVIPGSSGTAAWSPFPWRLRAGRAAAPTRRRHRTRSAQTRQMSRDAKNSPDRGHPPSPGRGHGDPAVPAATPGGSGGSRAGLQEGARPGEHRGWKTPLRPSLTVGRDAGAAQHPCSSAPPQVRVPQGGRWGRDCSALALGGLGGFSCSWALPSRISHRISLASGMAVLRAHRGWAPGVPKAASLGKRFYLWDKTDIKAVYFH